MVLAPEHSLVDQIVTEEQWPAVREYRERTARKSDLERTELAKEKTGVFTGAYAINPANERKDSDLDRRLRSARLRHRRDHGRARRMTSAILSSRANSICRFGRWFSRRTMKPAIGFVGDGIAINSPVIDGLPSRKRISKITAWLEERGLGKRAINYKLRDWLFSRQRYWGEPFPIVWEESEPDGRSKTSCV